VRCKLCWRFYGALSHVFRHREELRVIYEAKFKTGSRSKHALVLASHGVRCRGVPNWLITELEHLNGKAQKRLTSYFGSKKRMEDPPKVVEIRHNDTGADMNAVATLQQEHLHCHIVRYAILRCTISGTMYPIPARSNQLRYMLNWQGNL